MYCLHFNLQVYKKYFIILTQGDIKHLPFFKMKGVLVQGEEYSQSVSALRRRAVSKAGPGFQAAKGWPCGRRGRGQEKGESWLLAESLCHTHTHTQTHKKCIRADYTTNEAERYCNSQGLTMTSQDRPRDRGMKRRWADMCPLDEAVE